MYEMKISAAEEIAAEKETYNESNKFTCKRCHEQQEEDEKKERMVETIQELKKKIEELQEDYIVDGNQRCWEYDQCHL